MAKILIVDDNAMNRKLLASLLHHEGHETLEAADGKDGLAALQVGRIYENGSLYREVEQHAARLLVEMEKREGATAKLRESETRFRQLAENIQDVFFVISPDYSRTFYLS